MVCRASGFRCGDVFLKSVLALWLSGYFVGPSIFIGMTLSLVAKLYCCGLENFWETASATKRKHPGREPLLRTPESIEWLLQVFVRSPPLAGMCRQGTPPHRHSIQEVNIVIKMLSDKDNFSNKFTLKDSILSFYSNLKIVRFFCWTL